MTDNETILLAEKAERAALLQQLLIPDQDVDRLGIVSIQTPSATDLLVAGMPRMLCNRVFMLGLETPATETDLDEILAYSIQQEVPCLIRISPGAQPEELPRWLTDRGLTRDGTSSKMIRGRDPVVQIPTEFEIRQVGVEETERFGHVFCESFGLPTEYAATSVCRECTLRWFQRLTRRL